MFCREAGCVPVSRWCIIAAPDCVRVLTLPPLSCPTAAIMGEGILVAAAMTSHHRIATLRAALRSALTGEAAATGGEGLQGEEAA